MAGRGRSNADPLLVVALAQGMTVAEAAKAAGVGERTVYRRLEDPQFVLRIDAAQEDIVGRAVGLLAAGTVDAVSTLRKLATEAEEHMQFRASAELLNQYTRLRAEHHAQVNSLEARASELRSAGPWMTVEQAMDLLVESGSDTEQVKRAWTVIRRRMDSETHQRLQTQLQAAEAERDWEEHRPPRRRRPK